MQPLFVVGTRSRRNSPSFQFHSLDINNYRSNNRRGNNHSMSSSQSAVEQNSTGSLMGQLQQDPAASGTVSLGAQSPVMAPSTSPSMNGRDNNLSSNASNHSQEMVSTSTSSGVTAARATSKVQVPTFKGSDSEDALMWLSSFKSAMSLNGISERNPHIFDHFRLALSDAALRWLSEHTSKYEDNRQVLRQMVYNNLGLSSDSPLPVEELNRIEEQAKPAILKDFEKLKEEFIKRFAPKIRSSTAQIRLMKIQANQFNSITELYEELEHQWGMCQPPRHENLKMDDLLRALAYKVGYVAAVMERGPKSVTDAYQIALAREQGEALEYGLRQNYRMNSNPVQRAPQQSLQYGYANRERPYRNASNNYNESNLRSTSTMRFNSNRSGVPNVNAIGDSDGNQSQYVSQQEFMLAMNRIRDSINVIGTKLNEIQRHMTNPSSSGQSRSRSTIECYNCGKSGHYSSECPEPRKNRSSNQVQRNGRQNDRRNKSTMNQIDAGLDDVSQAGTEHENYFQDNSEVKDEDYYPSEEYDQEDKNDHQSDMFVINVSYEESGETQTTRGVNSVTKSLKKLNSSRTEKVSQTKNKNHELKLQTSPMWTKGILPGGINVKAILDTGAGPTVMSSRIFEKLPQAVRENLNPPHKSISLSAANGQSLSQRGVITVPLELAVGIKLKPLSFIVSDQLSNDIIIGNDHLGQKELFGGIHAAKGQVEYLGNGIKEVIKVSIEPETLPSISSKARETKDVKEREVKSEGRAVNKKNDHNLKRDTNRRTIGSVRVLEKIVIQPRTELMIPGEITRAKGVGHFRDHYVAPRKQKLGSSYTEPVLLIDRNQTFKSPVRVINSISSISEELLSGQTGVPVHLSNRTDQPVTLRPGTRIAVIQAIEQTNVTQVGQRRMNINAISQSQGNNSQQQ